MKIVVIGGSGLIGSKVVNILRSKNHEVVAASPRTGVNAITGEGLDEAFNGADVVVDVANSPSFEDKAVMEFFESSGKNITAAEIKAGVKHHVALSVVGTDRLPESGYFRAKLAQEKLIKASKIPYTIVQATQFFEFLGSIAESGAEGKSIRLSSNYLQPIAAADVAKAVAEAALAKPLNGTIEIAGPEKMPLADMVQRFLTAKGDTREITSAADVPYFGAVLSENTLVPGENASLGKISFEDWFKAQ